MANRDPAAEQLNQYKSQKEKSPEAIATTAGGAPLVNKDSSLTLGPRGPMVLHDVQFVEELAHFVRERIPERVLHAKGSGAFGYFEVTNNEIFKYTFAKLFSHVGKRTPIVIRFSTTAGELGSAEAARDPKGMSVKFQTEDGIFDLIGNHQPVFFLRDPVLFPSLVHATKRNPKTHLPDADMFWDFMSLRTETIHQVMHLFSHKGIPNGWRMMNCYPANVYKLIKEESSHVYCKFMFESNQKPLLYLTDEEAAAVGPDHYTKDLYNAIENRQFPSWTMKVQIMSESAARGILRSKPSLDPFDVTKVWPETIPSIIIGKICLTSNPSNFFAEIEQLAFAPANLVPGIEPSLFDRILQGRIFVYPDAQRYRLGPNYQHLGANRSLKDVKNYQRDGTGTFFHQGDDPIYHPNSFKGPRDKAMPHRKIVSSGEAEDLFINFVMDSDDDFWQSRAFYNGLDEIEKDILAKNLARSLADVQNHIRKRAMENFKTIDEDLFLKIQNKLR